MIKTIATPPDKPSLHVEMTPKEIAVREASELANVIKSIPRLIKEYRDRMICVDITLHGATVKNNTSTMDALKRTADTLLLDETKETVDWVEDRGSVSLNSAQLYEIYMQCFDRQQKCFSASSVVLAAHKEKPYTTIQSAYDAFDAEMVRLQK